MVLYYHVYYHLGKPWCIDGELYRLVVNNLCYPVNNN